MDAKHVHIINMHSKKHTHVAGLILSITITTAMLLLKLALFMPTIQSEIKFYKQ